jgi:hypothetical protein
MKTRFNSRTVFVAGYALMTTLIFAAVSIVLVTSTLNWTSGSFRVTERNNAYNRAVSAAESSVECVIARMDRDFLNRSIDYNNLTPYRLTVPTTYMPTGWPLQYQFTDTNNVVDHTTVIGGVQSVQTNIDPQLPGLYGIVFPARVASFAKRLGTPGYDVAAGVQQDISLVIIPIFQFEAFYSLDLEINPGPQMQITGKVHGNANMFLAPQTGLEFFDGVEAVGKVYYDRMTNDPAYGSGKVMPVFDLPPHAAVSGAESMTLPIGTNNAPSAVVKILDVPPAGEDPLSALGAARLYNQSDLIVTTYANGAVSVMAGRWDLNQAVAPDITNGTGYSFITITNTFFDQRENKSALVTDLDVGAFNKWLTNTAPNGGAALNIAKKTKFGTNATPAGLNSIYIDDRRLGSTTSFAAVRVGNGQTLPPDGLTVATARPIYVMGNYNVPTADLGSLNTANTKPAALMGDAISVLSGGWVDSKSTSPDNTGRPAQDDTVNAAFLAGIVETTRVNNVPHYSGGLENFPRFLENWNGKNFTYNGSMVVMFPSRFATSWWVGPSSTTYYQAPKRNWAFDKNYLASQKLPPNTPGVLKLVRRQWTTIAAASP